MLDSMATGKSRASSIVPVLGLSVPIFARVIVNAQGQKSTEAPSADNDNQFGAFGVVALVLVPTIFGCMVWYCTCYRVSSKQNSQLSKIAGGHGGSTPSNRIVCINTDEEFGGRTAGYDGRSDSPRVLCGCRPGEGDF